MLESAQPAGFRQTSRSKRLVEPELRPQAGPTQCVDAEAQVGVERDGVLDEHVEPGPRRRREPGTCAAVGERIDRLVEGEVGEDAQLEHVAPERIPVFEPGAYEPARVVAAGKG